MFSRHTLLLLMLFLAALVPFLSTSSSDLWQRLSSLWSSSQGQATASSPAGRRSINAASTVQPPAKEIQTESGPPAVHDLSEVINFEVTPTWVMKRWPRVSAGLAELSAQGYRVPLVSGTDESDLAGSLTYYFDKSQRVERIGFHGATGDPRQIIECVTTKYKLKRQATNDPSLWLFQSKWDGKVQSELRVRPARVVRADVPRARFETDLWLTRPR